MANKPQRNVLDLTPRRAVGHEAGDGGMIVLLRPKFTWGPLSRWLMPRLANPYFRVRLDAIGSAVWDSIDGARTVAQIACLLRERFGEEVEPAEQRVALFVRSLEQGHLVEYAELRAGPP